MPSPKPPPYAQYEKLSTDAPYTELQVMEDGAPPIMPKYKTLLLNFTQFGLNFLVLLLSVVVVPAQVEKLVGGAHKGRTMGGMVAGGAGVTFLASPLIGMISDRISSSLGRRRPVMLVGTALLCGGLLGMAVSAPEINTHQGKHETNKTVMAGMHNTTYKHLDEAHCVVDLVERRCSPFQKHYNATSNPAQLKGQAAPLEASDVAGHAQGVIMPRNSRYQPEIIEPAGNLGLYIVFFLIVITSQATVAVPFNALVADISHPSQRGFNSGVMGAMILLGNVTGAIAGVGFTHIGVLSMYAIIIGQLVFCILVTTFSITESTAKVRDLPSLSCKTVFIGFWSPLKEHDFRWVFITRFLMQQGVATITGFLEYWLNDMIPLPYCWTAATSVALLLLPLLFSAAVSSLVFGIISDKTGYRKVIVTIASLVMGLGSFVNAFLSGDYSYYIAAIMAFIIGLGFGAYQSVDFALVMDVLADDADKAKDIAVWHQALVLPQALATPLGGIVLDVFERVNCRAGLGYILIFLLSSLYFVLSGIFVFKIRRAR